MHRQLQDAASELASERSRAAELEARCADAQAVACSWQEKFCAERIVRRRVRNTDRVRSHNSFLILAAWQPLRDDAQVTEELHVLRGNIRVLCRVRPLADGAAVPALEFPRQGAIVVQDKRPHAYEFDAVFSPAVEQARFIFTTQIRSLQTPATACTAPAQLMVCAWALHTALRC